MAYERGGSVTRILQFSVFNGPQFIGTPNLGGIAASNIINTAGFKQLCFSLVVTTSGFATGSINLFMQEGDSDGVMITPNGASLGIPDAVPKRYDAFYGISGISPAALQAGAAGSSEVNALVGGVNNPAISLSTFIQRSPPKYLRAIWAQAAGGTPASFAYKIIVSGYN